MRRDSSFKTLSYDTYGRLTSISVPGVQSLSIAYDKADRIVVKTNGIDPSQSESDNYDDQSRLTAAYGAANNENYEYDADGNRIAQTVNGATATFGISPASNRLMNVSGAVSQSYGYDPQGNLQTVNGATAFQYNPFNRLASASGANDYVSPEGQRLRKTSSTGTTYFAPEGASLMAESVNGTWIDYVWLNGRLIGRASGSAVHAVHDDQTGRPQMVTDASSGIVWKANNYPFDRTVAVDSIGGLNVGFPGQYYDAERGAWNNGYRDYNASLGRYIESDLSGLAGGINTYDYVGGSPLGRIDPTGLSWRDAIKLSFQWATGTGPQHQDFGPDSSEAAEMANAPGVLAAVALYRQKNAARITGCDGSPLVPVTNYAAHFGLKGLFQSGLNPTEQFIGSYRVDVYPAGAGQMDVVINNTSSFRSFAYGLGPDWGRSRFSPMGNMSQTIHITVNNQ